MATNLHHIVIRYGIAYAAELAITQVPVRADYRHTLLGELHPSHEPTYRTKGTMPKLLCLVKTNLFINIKDKGLY